MDVLDSLWMKSITEMCGIHTVCSDIRVQIHLPVLLLLASKAFGHLDYAGSRKAVIAGLMQTGVTAFA